LIPPKNRRMVTTDLLTGDWREWRRLRALHLKQQVWYQRSIAVALGVAEDSVGRWIARARAGGRKRATVNLLAP
jgi:hypothetical protein